MEKWEKWYSTHTRYRRTYSNEWESGNSGNAIQAPQGVKFQKPKLRYSAIYSGVAWATRLFKSFGIRKKPCAFYFITTRRNQMKPTTNIYVMVDTSFKMQGYSAKIQTLLARFSRALSFQKHKTKLHIIGYQDKAKLLSPYAPIRTGGNPNFGEALQYLESVIRYQRKYERKQTRSVFLWITGENVLQGWQNPMESLFKQREFAFGARYIVYFGNPDKYAKEAFYRFVDSPDRILCYFSENRLCGLVMPCNLPTSRKN